MFTTRGSEYIGGLWRDSLITDLAWRRKDAMFDLDSTASPVNGYAPSWSWAAGGGQIDYFREVHKDHRPHEVAQLLNCRMIPSGEDTFGHLARGELVLIGPCMKAELKYSISSRLSSKGDPVKFLIPSIDIFSTARSKYPQRPRNYQFFHDEIFEEHDPRVVPEGTTIKVMILFEIGSDTLGMFRGSTYCLVLKRVDVANGIFQRMGLIKTWNRWITMVEHFSAITESLTII